MADNVGITEGAGPRLAAADEIGNVLYQRVKIMPGNDGQVEGDVSSSNPLPTQEVGSAYSLLSRILAVLMSPLGFDRALSRQRVTGIIESGTVTTVTTVATVSSITAGTITTVGGLTNIDGRNGAMLVNQSNLSAWRDCVRSCIT